MRLDLEREVGNEIIDDCIDVAEQAPTGGNGVGVPARRHWGSRPWVIVRDPELKVEIPELCVATGGEFVTSDASP